MPESSNQLRWLPSLSSMEILWAWLEVWIKRCRCFTAMLIEGYPRGGEFIGRMSLRSETQRCKGTQGLDRLLEISNPIFRVLAKNRLRPLPQQKDLGRAGIFPARRSWSIDHPWKRRLGPRCISEALSWPAPQRVFRAGLTSARAWRGILRLCRR
jgi:hypothetical protein